MGYGAYEGEFVRFDRCNLTVTNVKGGIGGGDEDEIVTLPMCGPAHEWSTVATLEPGERITFDLDFDFTVHGEYPAFNVRATHQNTRDLLKRIEKLEGAIRRLLPGEDY